MADIITISPLAESFKGLWGLFSETIITEATKVQWENFEWSQAATRYEADMKHRHNLIDILSLHQNPIERLFTPVKLKLKSNPIDELFEEEKDSLQVVRNYHRLFILGKPGAGKTTLLKYLVLQALNGHIDRIPIFVSLHEFAETKETLLDFIIKQFRICDFPDAQSFICTILQKENALVLFDGLDEVREEDGLRERVLREVTTFSAHYYRSQVVVTCRLAVTDYLFHWSSYVGFKYMEISDFDQEQIAIFVQNWFRTSSAPSDAETMVERFLAERMETKNQRLLELTKNPLLLTLLCIIYKETVTLPTRRCEIYDKALNALLKKWDVAAGQHLWAWNALSLERKQQMLARIAAETFERGQYLYHQDDLVRRIGDYLRGLPQIDKNAELDRMAIMRAIEAQHEIFVETDQRIYSFAHLAFQEYYAARSIVENAHKDRLQCLIRTHCFDVRWRDVFLLTAEMIDNADEFFEILLSILNDFTNHSIVSFLKKVAYNVHQLEESPELSPSLNLSHLDKRIVVIGVMLECAKTYNFEVTETIIDALYCIFTNASYRGNVPYEPDRYDNHMKDNYGALKKTFDLAEKSIHFFTDAISASNTAFVDDVNYTDRDRTIILQYGSKNHSIIFSYISDLHNAKYMDFNYLTRARNNARSISEYRTFRRVTNVNISRLVEFSYRDYITKNSIAMIINLINNHRLLGEYDLTGLADALKCLQIPSESATIEKRQAFIEQLIKTIRTHLSPDYEFINEEAEHLTQYLNVTALLIDCLAVAYVTDRAVIEDRLLCALP